jgi:nicotinate phosphoribosyltransferase
MGVSEDAPSLNSAYKLVSYAGTGRMKLSSDKATLPGRKQVFRHYDDGTARRDVIGLREESSDGDPLLQQVMKGGTRLPTGQRSLEESREHAERSLAMFPERIRTIEPADPPYPVRISDQLAAERDAVRQRTHEMAAA